MHSSYSLNISGLTIAIDNCNQTLAHLDELENKRPLTIPESNFRNILKKHILRLLQYQKLYWKKRCTVRWSKFGDENTKVFQAVATKRYHNNNIASFLDNEGNQVEDHTSKEALLFQTYKNRLGSSSPAEMKFDLPSLLRRSNDLEHLTDPFTHEEIDAIVKEMPPDRAPGPDGFSGAFLKACWPLIKNDFITYAPNPRR